MGKGHIFGRMRTAGIVGALVASVALTGCGTDAATGELAEGSWDDVIAAAKEEGQLSVYNGGSELPMQRTIDAFNEKYPEIKVTAERITSDGIARVESQIKTGTAGADFFLHADPNWYKQRADDLLEVEGPNTEGVNDRNWVVENASVTATGVPYSLFVWNTDKFPQGFKTWDDILAPEVKGQLAWRDSISTTSAGYLDFLLEAPELGPKYVEALGKQKPKYYASVVPATTAVGAGEVGVTIASSPAEVKALQAAGAPVDFEYTEPAFAIEYAAAALKNARHPNAAALFFDFMVSEEGQEALNGDGLGIALRDGVEGTLDASTYSLLDSEKYTPEEIEKSNEKMATYFKK